MKAPKTKRKSLRIVDGYLFTLPGHRFVAERSFTKGRAKDVKKLCQKPIKLDRGYGEELEWLCQEPRYTAKFPTVTQPTTEEMAEFWVEYLVAEKPPPQNTTNPIVLAERAKTALGILAKMASDGDGKAAWLFGETVYEACQVLSKGTRLNPKAWAPLARKLSRWPLMRSTAPLNSDPDSWLVDMQLGSSAGLCFDKFSKWKPDLAATYALRLIEHLKGIREDSEITIDGKPASGFLPPLSRETAGQWWKIAWKFLLFTYPKPEEVEELDKLVTAPTKRKSAGRRKQAIHDILKKRFTALTAP